jgi:hypothetical protein
VAPPRLGKASEQRRRVRLEVKHTAVDAARAQSGKVLGQRGQRRTARVDAHRDAVVPRLGEEVDHFEQQIGGQIVDAVVAAVLEDMKGDGLARARQAANQD